MTFSSAKALVAVVAAGVAASSAFAQSQELRFEAVVIKPIGGGGAPIPFSGEPYFPGGVFKDPGVTLRVLIEMVYNIDDYKIVGLPAWAEDAVYSIHANAGPDYPAAVSPNQNRENIKAMIRTMLADRFQFQMHQEDRETDVLVLQVKGDRAKLQPVAAPVAPETGGWPSILAGDLRGSIAGKKVTMNRFAASLTRELKQRVVDGTDLTGFYDFNETWGTPWQRGEPANANKLGPEGTAQLFSVLGQNLGLELKPRKLPVDYWVVHRVEKPGEN